MGLDDKRIDLDKIERAVEMILEAIGEDPDREGLRDTPRRVAMMYGEILGGIEQEPDEELKLFFTHEHDEMIIVKDIFFASLCEHHLLPFIGKAHVAYVPQDNRITGLSKIARVVDSLARRPQMQERLTTEIADTIMRLLKPQGVLVVVEAEHTCMTIRGIRKPGSRAVTSAMRGVLRQQATRAEALSLITSKD
jgi:GTP cyclohydrolase I